MRTMVKIVYPVETRHVPVYTVQPDDLKEKLISGGHGFTKWLCGNCRAFTYGTSLYAQIDPKCDAHGHVLKQGADSSQP